MRLPLPDRMTSQNLFENNNIRKSVQEESKEEMDGEWEEHIIDDCMDEAVVNVKVEAPGNKDLLESTYILVPKKNFHASSSCPVASKRVFL